MKKQCIKLTNVNDTKEIKAILANNNYKVIIEPVKDPYWKNKTISYKLIYEPKGGLYISSIKTI